MPIFPLVARTLVGTSGYVYPHWKRILYPEKLPARLWLGQFARVFPTTELNNTFYRLPTADAVDGWRERTPKGFTFAVKGSRFLTHMKRLLETGEGLEQYFSLVRRLGPKLGPVLWQLPPQMNKLNLERLENFCAALPTDIRQVFEFRSPVWYVGEVADLLEAHQIAFCEHDLVDAEIPRVTGGFRYLRFHGKTGKYSGRYGRLSLKPVAKSLRASEKAGVDSYVYFNNDLHGHALYDALDLMDLLGESRGQAWREVGAAAIPPP